MKANELGAMMDYALGVGLLAVVSFVPLYRYFQSQTKPFCMVLGPLAHSDNVAENTKIGWGAGSDRDSDKVVCYAPVYQRFGKGTKLVKETIFSAGYIVIEN
jgi:hypothetical protein